MFAESKTVELVNRPHVDLFQQDHLIPPYVDLHMTLMPAANNFVCNSVDPGNQAQENFKVKILHAELVIHTKQLTDVAGLAQRELLLLMNMKLPYTRVQMKKLSISAKQTSKAIENIFTGALPNLVVIGLVADADSAGGYQSSLFNFQTFGVNRLVLMRNEPATPRDGYKPNWTSGEYVDDYWMMQEQLGSTKAISASR